MSDTILTDLQADIAGRLAADAVLGALNIVSETTGDIEGEINAAMGVIRTAGGKRGLCLVVLQMTANPETQEAPGPLLELKIGVRVLENPTLNNHGIRALTVARRVARILHHYQPGGLTSLLLASTPCILGVVEPTAPVAYELAFTAREASTSIDEKAAAPLITSSSPTVPGTITISSTTPGASIYWTIDGSHPRGGAAGSTLYSAPFAVATAARIRAVAYATGMVASNASALDLG